MNLAGKYKEVRSASEEICNPLKTEDYVVQPIADVSPPKWHLAHTTWFFETLILKPFLKGYKEFDPNFSYVFNSYYESIGARVIRNARGSLSRPTVDEVYTYRDYIDNSMHKLLNENLSHELEELVILGLNHEQQHQELLWTDIKFILGNNPLFPVYKKMESKEEQLLREQYIKLEKGLYEIGYRGNSFCYDNELGPHCVYLQDFEISNKLVTNEEFLEFINAGGYNNFIYWHSDGWDWIKNSMAEAPLYWHKNDGNWHQYTLSGPQPVSPEEPVSHINYYEAAAYAAWKGKRLPTEFEWEAAANKFSWGKRWEWTESAYLPYPGFKKASGTVGEYNGKFMVNQKVLRGASEFTPAGHSRITYRNFFQPHHRWQNTGIRLAN
jgi:ergothioneine biosynthesis protein EgtB